MSENLSPSTRWAERTRMLEREYILTQGALMVAAMEHPDLKAEAEAYRKARFMLLHWKGAPGGVEGTRAQTVGPPQNDYGTEGPNMGEEPVSNPARGPLCQKGQGCRRD